MVDITILEETRFEKADVSMLQGEARESAQRQGATKKANFWSGTTREQPRQVKCSDQRRSPNNRKKEDEALRLDGYKVRSEVFDDQRKPKAKKSDMMVVEALQVHLKRFEGAKMCHMTDCSAVDQVYGWNGINE